MDSRISSIILVKSEFERSNKIDLDSSKADGGVSIEVDTILTDKLPGIIVTLDLNYTLKSNKTNDTIVRYYSKHVAQVEVKNYEALDPLKIKRFGGVNIAAMIFPFVREDLSSRVLKSGLRPIILPPFNFVKLYDEKNPPTKGPVRDKKKTT
ncbi:preprotein translocase subunit SecB [Chryseobacterium sp. PvR013]|uniref:protein-export chaperone SecB n=1 Tax=Chryseobacterium sp. PvR013 TaxID=2806595 RepID=UPI001AE61666|nr:protein-export chaperone SecB [Chryseobacterium sp. PvR013]MBP1165026.1 preprotein translocase subunit SecB [Chryseobacterium sp. PvR013]